jgi:hypothetical protein
MLQTLTDTCKLWLTLFALGCGGCGEGNDAVLSLDGCQPFNMRVSTRQEGRKLSTKLPSNASILAGVDLTGDVAEPLAILNGCVATKQKDFHVGVQGELAKVKLSLFCVLEGAKADGSL